MNTGAMLVMHYIIILNWCLQNASFWPHINVPASIQAAVRLDSYCSDPTDVKYTNMQHSNAQTLIVKQFTHPYWVSNCDHISNTLKMVNFPL